MSRVDDIIAAASEALERRRAANVERVDIPVERMVIGARTDAVLDRSRVANPETLEV